MSTRYNLPEQPSQTTTPISNVYTSINQICCSGRSLYTHANIVKIAGCTTLQVHPQTGYIVSDNAAYSASCIASMRLHHHWARRRMQQGCSEPAVTPLGVAAGQRHTVFRRGDSQARAGTSARQETYQGGIAAQNCAVCCHAHCMA